MCRYMTNYFTLASQDKFESILIFVSLGLKHFASNKTTCNNT